jgi:hypothetical protein
MWIPIIIPVGRKFTATASGRAIKGTVCEQCKTEYVYALERSQTAEVHAPLFLNVGARDEAMSQADKSLSNILDRAVEPVPCPSCGHYQQYMIPLARKRHLRWMNLAAIIFGVVAGIGFLAYVIVQSVGHRPDSPEALPVLAACVAVVVAIPIARLVMIRRYDPNASDARRRIELGLSLALTKDEYLQQLRDQEEAIAAVNCRLLDRQVQRDAARRNTEGSTPTNSEPGA